MPTAEKREPGLIICDERRRVTLPKGLAEEGEEFIAFKVRGDIILKPLIKDALNVFRREGKKLKVVREVKQFGH